jgi:hypothetical protein
MNLALSCVSMRLGRRQFLQLVDGAGISIHCVRGYLWITQHGDSRDIVVRPHESFLLDRPGAAIIQALTDSTVDLEEPTPAPDYPSVRIQQPPRGVMNQLAWPGLSSWLQRVPARSPALGGVISDRLHALGDHRRTLLRLEMP